MWVGEREINGLLQMPIEALSQLYKHMSPTLCRVQELLRTLLLAMGGLSHLGPDT